MARVQCLFAFWLLSTCVSAPAQVSVQSFFCQGVVLGLLPVNLELLIGDNITPGVPIRAVVGLTVNLQNSIENYRVGTYSANDSCSLTTSAFTVTFDIPITLVIAGSPQRLTYTVLVSDFTGSFNLGAQGNLSVSLHGGTRGPIGIFASFVELINTGTVLFSQSPPATPLPPSIILTLTGLAGVGLLAARRKLARPS